jgi:uncharacterized membrane protein
MGYSGTLSPTSQRAELLDVAAALIAVILLVLVRTGQPGPLRVLLTLGFTFFVPGRAIVTNWPRMARWSAVGMSMVLSLAVLTLLATTFLWAHLWQPVALFQAEAVLSLAGLAVGAVRRRKAR